MFIKSPALASDEFELLLYRVRFVTLGTFSSIVMFGDFSCVWFTVRLFPALSNLTIYSNNHNTSLATLGNTLNITIDKNVPSVTNLTIYSNNSNSSLARAG